MIAGVVVGIADQDVENNAGKKLPKCPWGFFEFGSDKLGQDLVTGIAGHHFIQLQKGQGRHHALALPPLGRGDSVKPLHYKHILGGGSL